MAKDFVDILRDIASQTVPQTNGGTGDRILREQVARIAGGTKNVAIVLAEFVQRAMELAKQNGTETPSPTSGETPLEITLIQKQKILELLGDLPYSLQAEEKSWIQFLMHLYGYQTTHGTMAFLREVSEQILECYKANDQKRLSIIFQILRDCDLITLFRKREGIKVGEQAPEKPQVAPRTRFSPKPIHTLGPKEVIKTLLETLESMIESGLEDEHIATLMEHFGTRKTVIEDPVPLKKLAVMIPH